MRISTKSMLLFALFWLPFLHAGEDLPEIPPGAVAPKDTTFHEFLTRGQRLHFSDRYRESLALFEELKKTHPTHPAPYFYTAATYQAWMNSFRFNTYQAELEANVDQAIKAGELLLQDKPDDAWLNFYIGAAYGYRAFYKMASYNWIGAYLDGRKGIKNFEMTLEKEPELYDVYLGLGAYHYWRTARSKFIRVVAFWMSDKRDIGLEQIRIAIRHGRYAALEATLALVVSLYDYGQYGPALELIENFIASREVTVSMRYYRAQLLIRFERWVEVGESFTKILAELEARPESGTGYKVECLSWMATASYKLGDVQRARELADRGLALAEQRDGNRELESSFESYDDMLKRFQQLHHDIQEQ